MLLERLSQLVPVLVPDEPLSLPHCPVMIVISSPLLCELIGSVNKQYPPQVSTYEVCLTLTTVQWPEAVAVVCGAGKLESVAEKEFIIMDSRYPLLSLSEISSSVHPQVLLGLHQLSDFLVSPATVSARLCRRIR